jgi:metal-responsive CopG/Arc/MetJ family transcriptional regulator
VWDAASRATGGVVTLPETLTGQVDDAIAEYESHRVAIESAIEAAL